MKKAIISFCLIVFVSLSLFAQKKGTIKGTVTDASTGESLIGVNVQYASGKGTITDLDGKYILSVEKGEYTLKVSYVGYKTVEKIIIVKDKTVYSNFKLKTIILTGVEVFADVARSRETPVAFSTVLPATIEEELASQDIPMILNKTPGVYATQQGGGDGDARINIRGFNQRNVAVMIDGIPVNDMESGWVYWSNWFGLDVVTRTIQVQRGLGASKLAIPSVGGTLNIISKGIEAKKGATIKQEFANDGYTRTTLGLTTGQMKKGWGVTFSGSYKKGDGWIDRTWTEGYFYFLRVDKKLGNHVLSLSAMGAPQEHGQRSYKSAITTHDTAYAREVGIATDDFIAGKPVNLGRRYNPNWGYLDRYAIGGNGDTIHADREMLNEKKNYYHKPQISLRDFWNVNDKLYISNILYLSIGTGGGTGLTGTTNPIQSGPDRGSVDFQTLYNTNISDNGTKEAGKGEILRSSVNNHFWYGLLTTASYKMNEEFNFSGGIDLRDYKGEHYRETYDMLGADYYIDEEDVFELTNKTLNTTKRYKGDKIDFHNDGHVRWGGLFFQTEYKSGNITAFINLSGAYSGYKRIDYFKYKDLVIDGEVFEQAVGYTPKFDLPSGVFVILQDTFMHDGTAYTAESPEARYSETEWKWIPGYTVKGGLNYNLSEKSNIFANLGYISKAPRFNNVYDYDNRLYREIKNEKIKAVELGYSFFNSKMTLNINAYLTLWENKPADYPPSIPNDGEFYKVNVNGIDANHKGIEFEYAYKIFDKITLESILSIGDWKWTSAETARLYDDKLVLVDSVEFDAKGIYVGDAAQIQNRESIRWEIIKDLYLKASFTYFAKNYSNFDPLDYDVVNNAWAFENGEPRQSWRMPNYYIVDVHAGYRLYIKKIKVDLRASILNLLDEVYITDADNNDSHTGQGTNSFNASSAGVFFGLGRRFNISLKITI